MNALSVMGMTRDEWVQRGRELATRRREVDWDLADWMAEGKSAGHLTQITFDFLAESLGLAPKRLKDAQKAAETFPPALRDRNLSIEHHAAVASLPRDEALPLLKRASQDHLPVNALREYVTQHRYATGQNFADDDMDSTLCTHILRAWNRATPEARRLAFDRIKAAARAGFTIIDEDEVCDVEE